ncbi:MAG: hypothetical protein SH856_02910 [Flavobacteriales bacterium]|nr:hypothetical protein [Flavobacteriales bacterium]
MNSHKLEIKTIIFSVAVLSMIIFALVQMIIEPEHVHDIGELLLHYGFLIAPITLLWVAIDKVLWHTVVFKAFRNMLSLPPDLRGRWEGKLFSSLDTQPQSFVIEIKQSLTSLHVYSYSSYGHSRSILVDIATDNAEDHFVLCFLWQGEVPTKLDNKTLIQKFHGYTLLTLNEHTKPKTMKGTYFTDHLPDQTHGTIELTWAGLERKQAL